MLRTRECLAASCILLAAHVAVAQVAERIQQVEDIEQWRVEVYSGTRNPGGLVQGPRKRTSERCRSEASTGSQPARARRASNGETAGQWRPCCLARRRPGTHGRIRNESPGTAVHSDHPSRDR